MKYIRKRELTYLIMAAGILFCLGGCKAATGQCSHADGGAARCSYQTVMKRDILCIMAGYPGFVEAVEKDGKDVYLVMKSGRRIIYDDHREKSKAEKLSNPDIQDMLEHIYPLNRIKELADPWFDPGRARVYELLREVYGENEKEVLKMLVSVPAGSSSVLFNARNKAALKLGAVFRELSVRARDNPLLYRYISANGGTFNYRYIAGTGRLSAHAFGTAIDLAVNRDDYWKWTSRDKAARRLTGYPFEMAEVFEKHGFIWGGKWGHFDMMHYEYRPEIIFKAVYFSSEELKNKSWHGGLMRFDDEFGNCIEYLDSILTEE